MDVEGQAEGHYYSVEGVEYSVFRLLYQKVLGNLVLVVVEVPDVDGVLVYVKGFSVVEQVGGVLDLHYGFYDVASVYLLLG